MKQAILILLSATLLFSCTTRSTESDSETGQVAEETNSQDTIPKVTGIGGIFFFSDNLDK